jgi:hypothetical protein
LAELREERIRESLSHDVSQLFLCADLLHSDPTVGNMLTKVMHFVVDVLITRTDLGQADELAGAGVVTKELAKDLRLWWSNQWRCGTN